MPWPAAAGGHAVQDRVGAACVGNKLWEAGTGRAGGMGRALALKAAQRPRQLPPYRNPPGFPPAYQQPAGGREGAGH